MATNLITWASGLISRSPRSSKSPIIAHGGTLAPVGVPVTAPRRSRRLFPAFLILLPALWGIVYYGFIASDRYVSESTFVVRTSSRSAVGGFAAFLRMVGVSASQDDTFAVHDFINSRDAIRLLQEKIDIRKVYGHDGIDWLARYPNIFYDKSEDELRRYLTNRIIVTFNSNTGISTLKIQAFRPDEAQMLSKYLLEISEKMINQMNERIHSDAVRFSQEEVHGAEERLRKAQMAISDFRNREIQIDPNRSSVLVMELVAKLSDEMSRLSAQIAEVRTTSPNSPQIQSLERRSEALRSQIQAEQGRITNSSDGLAKKIARYEELNLEREFAAKSLASAIIALDNARAEARRQLLYLERISGPSLPDRATQPERTFEIISILIANLVVLLVAWLVVTGITEHAPKLKKGQG